MRRAPPGEWHEVGPVEADRAAADPAVIGRMADDGEADRRLARSGFTHETQRLVALKRESDVADDLCRTGLAVIDDIKPLDRQDRRVIRHGSILPRRD